MTRGDKLDAGAKHSRWSVGFVLLLCACLTPACVRDVTEDDCKELAKHLHEVWTSDAKFPEKSSPSAEKAVAVIKSEGGKLEEAAFASCKREYMGKPKASGEFSCLSRAKTYAEVQACATIPVH